MFGIPELNKFAYCKIEQSYYYIINNFLIQATQKNDENTFNSDIVVDESKHWKSI